MNENQVYVYGVVLGIENTSNQRSRGMSNLEAYERAPFVGIFKELLMVEASWLEGQLFEM